MKAQKLNRRQAKWILYLSRFNFTLKHIPGIKMEKTDGLSKRLDWKVGIENDNINQLFIKDHWICNLYEVVIERPKVSRSLTMNLTFIFISYFIFHFFFYF